MESKHTRGPWHAGGYMDQIVFNDKGFAVASCTVYHGKELAGTSAANARLIAAAPDLLAALEAALGALDECDRFKPGLVDINVIVDVREAIAKAKGD